MKKVITVEEVMEICREALLQWGTPCIKWTDYKWTIF